MRINGLVASAWLLCVTTLLYPSLVSADSKKAEQATHDGLRKLTAANFTLTDHGAWLIEFFSPACTHCQKFGPTWSELSQNKENLRTQYPDAPFTLAQVDCVAQWDLCAEQGVKFLPRLTIYQDGKQHSEEYMGNRNYPEISAYIDQFAREYRKSKGVADIVTTSSALTLSDAAVQTSTNADTLANQQATDTTAAVTASTTATSTVSSASESASTSAAAAIVSSDNATLPSGPNPKGVLLSYGSNLIKTPEELQQWLGKSSGQGPTFVKFFAPWCPHCKAMAAAFKELGSSLKGRVNVLEVDCEANKSLCSSYAIRGYPVLRLYSQGQVKEYNGGRNHDAMLKWVLKAVSSSGLKPIATTSELAEVAKADEVVFLYLHSPGTSSDEIQTIESASQILFGSRAQIFTSSEDSMLERYATFLAQDKSQSVPAKSGLLVFKDHSISQPTSVLYPSTLAKPNSPGESIKTEVARWLSRQKYPLLTELTAANFEETVRNDAEALVVLAAISDTHHNDQTLSQSNEGTERRDKELETLRSLALEWREQHAELAKAQIVWAWIDADRWKSALSKLYGIKTSDLPALVLVDGHKQLYYPLPRQSQSTLPWLSSKSVFTAIQDSISGKIPPKSSRSLFQKSVRGAEVYLTTLLNACVDHPFTAFAFLFTLLGGLFFYLMRARKASPATLPLYSKVSTVKAD